MTPRDALKLVKLVTMLRNRGTPLANVILCRMKAAVADYEAANNVREQLAAHSQACRAIMQAKRHLGGDWLAEEKRINQRPTVSMSRRTPDISRVHHLRAALASVQLHRSLAHTLFTEVGRQRFMIRKGDAAGTGRQEAQINGRSVRNILQWGP
jgi:hypothetical protein